MSKRWKKKVFYDYTFGSFDRPEDFLASGGFENLKKALSSLNMYKPFFKNSSQNTTIVKITVERIKK